MDQLIVWAFVHHELTRQYRSRPRSDDAFYRGRRQPLGQAAQFLKVVWPGRQQCDR